MIGEYTVAFAINRIQRAREEITLIADALIQKKGATTQGGRHSLGRRLNSLNASLNTARMALDAGLNDRVKLSVWAVRYSGDGPREIRWMPEVDSLWVDEVEAWKRCDELNSGQSELPWYADRLTVNREWREVADATTEV